MVSDVPRLASGIPGILKMLPLRLSLEGSRLKGKKEYMAAFQRWVSEGIVHLEWRDVPSLGRTSSKDYSQVTSKLHTNKQTNKPV